jgi:hypothetical protein
MAQFLSAKLNVRKFSVVVIFLASMLPPLLANDF